MAEETLPQRTLKTTTVLVLFLAVVFMSRGQATISYGLLVGGALGLFSLWTLAFAIPRLITSGSVVGKFWLGLLTIFKLPVYAVTLYFAMTSSFIAPFAVFVGVALCPAVIVMKTLGQMLIETTSATRGEETCPTKASPYN